MGGDYNQAFTDGGKLGDGKAGSGRTAKLILWGQEFRSPGYRWDAEVTAMAETLKLSKGKSLLTLCDSQAAIAATVVKAGKEGHGRTRELWQVPNPIPKRCRNGETTVCLG